MIFTGERLGSTREKLAVLAVAAVGLAALKGCSELISDNEPCDAKASSPLSWTVCPAINIGDTAKDAGLDAISDILDDVPLEAPVSN
ncbi:MAG TPA: hypothetical protein VFK11_01750 [Candidatus Saccharimonadales bacterium]|nr:hypothetical protein [Candidatus Saccharimonadales bacterium]